MSADSVAYPEDVAGWRLTDASRRREGGGATYIDASIANSATPRHVTITKTDAPAYVVDGEFLVSMFDRPSLENRTKAAPTEQAALKFAVEMMEAHPADGSRDEQVTLGDVRTAETPR